MAKKVMFWAFLIKNITYFFYNLIFCLLIFVNNLVIIISVKDKNANPKR